ncbi:uncharacterized protein LOC109856403 isoform X2 [Pseudomyrmex gracilis]|uniref:uncharacterized protein LOC109856403 isoform X2 n=1 Tax=Pseudomyrmex gracilis TaxID=219809 RepID=UPI000995B70A|nr:uncharacterized protein LOC109856403 isoform X2 [Pseudomyrmex gracilis]
MATATTTEKTEDVEKKDKKEKDKKEKEKKDKKKEKDAPKEKDLPKKRFINTNLISLKCLLFVFYAGIGSLFPFLPLHMTKMGLSIEEVKFVSIVSPAVSILGPLVVGMRADTYLSSGSSNGCSCKYSVYLRLTIAYTCLSSALFYFLLLDLLPLHLLSAEKAHPPNVIFGCNENSSMVQQERCVNQCHRWPGEDSETGTMLLQNCSYVCIPHTVLDIQQKDIDTFRITVNIETDFNKSSGDNVALLDTEFDMKEEMKKAHRFVIKDEPPHLCYEDDNYNVICHVYTEYSNVLPINGTLGQALNPDDEEKYCLYPMIERFFCRISPVLEARRIKYNETCLVMCDLVDPYTHPGSVLKTAGDDCSVLEAITGGCSIFSVGWAEKARFWIYLAARSIADTSSMAALTLINAAVVIATRETSCGRGDVGRQLAFGFLGFALMGSLSGYLSTLTIDVWPPYVAPLLLHSGMMLLAVLIVLLACGMPLTRPERYWHTRNGMLALPLSAIKRYGNEIFVLVLILIVLGTFWSAMDSYLPLYLQKLGGDDLTIGITMTVGAVPTFLFLWKSEHLVDYCGHSNIFITAFTVYILRFIILSVMTGPWWSLISEALEVFTLGIMWVTAILYVRHLQPRYWVVTAQAMPVIAHFCVGRCLGAVIGAYVKFGDEDIVHSLGIVYRYMAIAATAVAILYFILYHGLVKPRCYTNAVKKPRQPPTIVQVMNGNGNYTPLRVYHNGKGRKGQFRY